MEETRIESRNRSRSKTPFLRSSCDNEQCAHAGDEDGHTHHQSHGDKKKKPPATPSVQTIAEERVEVTSSLSPSKKTANSDPTEAQQQTHTSEYTTESTIIASSPNKTKKSKDASISNQKKLSSSSSSHTSSSMTTTTMTSTKVTTKSQKQLQNHNIAGHTLGRATTSTPKTIHIQESFAAQFTGRRNGGGGGSGGNGVFNNNSSQRSMEINRNESNSILDRSKRQTSGASSSSGKWISNIFLASETGDISSNVDLNDHIAYKEYKEAGEYWKKYPKTDYTYSALSPHRREVIPGVIAMPNMSRQSLEKHNERVNYMIKRNPEQEDYIRRRYDWSFNRSKQSNNNNSIDNLIYDSQDELDMAQLSLDRKRFVKSSSEFWLTRIVSFFIRTISGFWIMLSGGSDYGDDSGYYGTKIVQKHQRGFGGSITSGIWSAILSVFQYIYLFISTVLCLDTWLLQSSNVENKNKKRLLLLLLVLLPLLLLAAWSQLVESDRTALMHRIQNLLPLTFMESLQISLSGAAIGLKDLFSHIPSIQFGSSHGIITDNIQKSLTIDEYQSILNHVDNYIQKLMDAKNTEHERQTTIVPKITPEISLLIVNSVRENIEQMFPNKVENSWNDNDIQQISDIVKRKLELGNWSKQQHSATESTEHNYYRNIDLDQLVIRVLESPKMKKFLDTKISSVDVELNTKTSLLIDELNKEIEFIKLALSEKLSENQQLHLSISNLQKSQTDLQEQFAHHELTTGNRLNSFLTEIEKKLSTLRDDQFVQLNRQIKISLVEILGFKKSAADGVDIDDVDLQNWVRNMFVAKEFLEQKLIELNSQTKADIKDEIDRSAAILMRDITVQLKKEIMKLFELKEKQFNATNDIRLAIAEDEIKRIVKNVLAIYDADKTGLVDFALESAGGQILSTRCTENYHTKSAQISIFGVPLWYPSNTPRIAISPNVQPGECWAFQGFPGFLVLKLNSLIYVTGFTLEHIPKSLAPNGRIDSAPKNFTVWGLAHEKDQNPVLFGEYQYEDNYSSLQYFPVQNTNAIHRPYNIVELRIETNHGNSRYTCLYRFRVHGKPPDA